MTGRIVDGEKQPVAGVQLTAFAGTPRNFDRWCRSKSLVTLTEGSASTFYPPVLYNISGFSPQFNAIEVAKEMKLAPGETVDFGTIDISSKKRPEPNRKQAAKNGGTSTLQTLTDTPEAAPASGDRFHASKNSRPRSRRRW